MDTYPYPHNVETVGNYVNVDLFNIPRTVVTDELIITLDEHAAELAGMRTEVESWFEPDGPDHYTFRYKYENH